MPTMAGKSTRLLIPKEEVEGDRQGTMDFVFCRIGEPVPLMPAHSDSAFDLSNPPFQPIAVSERHRLLFLAHTKGFLIANTKDVIELAKGVKGKGTCVQRSSVLDVQIGRVSILALSGDNSMIAAAVGGEIHLFFVLSLLDKVQEPAISCHLSKYGIVKDLKWRRNSENSFIVLSGHGLLCHGSSDLQLKDVMDNVDAADWSVDGKFVAIARKDTVSILSSNFEEILGIPLLFQSWAVDSGSEIKVDSIRWVRHDSIVIGCTQLMEDGDEEGYLVQVIVSGEHQFTEVSCKPVVFSFPDLFEGLSVDMLPTGMGPYLLADYLDCWDVAITSNKKNIDQHISLLRWLVKDNGYEVVSFELGSDKYIPRIDLQDDGDDNLILGLAVDKSSLYEKIKIQSDMEFKELSPRCILLCLTCDGKLTLNHAAWVSEPSHLTKMVSPHGDNNKEVHTLSSAESELEVNTSRLRAGLDAAISDKMQIIPGGKLGSRRTLDGVEPCSQGPGMITSSYSRRPAIEEPEMLSNSGGLGTKSSDNVIASDSLMVKGTGSGHLAGSTITAGSAFGLRMAQNVFGVDGSNASSSSTVKGTGASRSLSSTINEGSLSQSQTLMPFTVDAADAKHLFTSPGESNSARIGNKVLFSPPSNSPANFAPFSKPFGTMASSEKINQSGVQASSTKSGYTGSASILQSSSVAASVKLPGSRQQLLGNSTSSKPRQRLESEPQFSKQFYNVKDMTKELDALLSSIECEGGFKDLCTISQEQSLLALEAGLDDLSEVLFVYRDEIENQRIEIQQLCNKMLQVSARQVYMKGIVQQASDHNYWAFWNNRKLSREFEAKRLHISNLKQVLNLANQLLELERHFNSLEIKRFGEHDTTATGWRAPCNSTPSRGTQSLHSVYSTVNSQLSAAEQLSECLSKQMAVLNISSSTPEKRNVTKELFESIGLDPKTDAFMSPDLKSSNLLPYSSKKTSPSSASALKEQSWNCVPNDVNACKLESARRKRGSLDKNWAHFEPSRTTIKRTSTKEQVRSNLDIAFREAKEVFDSQVKAFDIAQKSGIGASSKAFDSQSKDFGITKRSSNEAASFLSKTTHSNSQSLEQSPNRGIQEKSSKIAIDAHSKPIFRWAKDTSDQRSEPNTSSNSISSQLFHSVGTQPSSFATPSIFSNANSNNNVKFGSPFMLNIGASSTLNNSSSPATKTALASKPTSVSTHMKFTSSNVSPLKTTSATETGSQLNQGTSLKNEVGTQANLTQESTKKLTFSSSTLSASISQATASLTSSSLSSFQFGNSMPPNIFLSPTISNAPTSFSNEILSKSMPSLARVPASKDSLSLNKIGSELEHATLQTSETTNKAATDGQPKELSSFPSKISSKLTTDTSQASVSDIFPPKKEVGLHPSVSDNVGTDNTNDSKSQQPTSQIPATSVAPAPIEKSSLPSTTNDNVLPAGSGFPPLTVSGMATSSSIMTMENLDANLSQEDEMEEEALDTNSMLNLESLGGFALQATPSTNAQKPNPFGGSFLPASTGSASPQLSWSASPGLLFRPPSFNLPESQSPHLSQSTGSSLTGGLSGGFSGFGQPAQLGSGQQALGSVLGSFGQSRQLGTGSPGFGFASAAGSGGGFSNTGGFAGVASGGGFAGAATGGGFAGVATGGGFAGAATGGGFAGVASNIGGFAGTGAGGGFGGASSGGGLATGGFGGFSSIAFGAGNSSAGRPPAELLTQMRK
ncbi:nuclear pore complex protein NUP214 isoform X3 [Dendrobium catenatum]|uniref:nuclear pore complex protein NUP214 isoform X3 n=1 Tax=Dendrobium catenatum TaxID=906689 RepID=UPI0009F3E541|nr:nuclear pore complex protein NUP214 isoform X3 [Dendrobium catenatum]